MAQRRNAKAAYDTIDREELWKDVDEDGIPKKLTENILIKATKVSVKRCFKMSGTLSGSLEIRKRLRLGYIAL